VLPATPDFPLLNAFIIFNVVVAEYLCYYVVTGNPGFLARGSIESTRAIVLDLVELNKFDSRNFCTTCLVNLSFFLHAPLVLIYFSNQTRSESRSAPSTIACQTSASPALTTTAPG